MAARDGCEWTVHPTRSEHVFDAYWIRDLPNPELKYVDTPARARSRAKAARTKAAKYKGLRDAAYRRGSDEYPELSTEPTFRDFVTLFLAEGYKRARNKVSIASRAAMGLPEGPGDLDTAS